VALSKVMVPVTIQSAAFAASRVSAAAISSSVYAGDASRAIVSTSAIVVGAVIGGPFLKCDA
jgi:hypothetical protein